MAKKRSTGRLFILGLGILAAAAAIYAVWGKKADTVPEVTTLTVARGDVIQAITATGVLQAPTSVDISSQISGQIQDVFADYNQTVKKGDVLARIDAATYESRLRQAEASLASTTASHTLTRLNTERTRELRAKNLVSQQELDQAEAQLSQANAQLLTSKASVEDAKVNLDRCTLYAPIDGIVLDRLAEVGKMVAASLNAPTLFTLVTSLSKMEISADVAEADIGTVAVDQEVSFTVDAYPNRPFRGRVAQIRNLPKTSQSVVVYATIIEVDNADLKLKPGMTANVSITVARRNDTLKVPNAALRARISEKYLPAAPTSPGPASGAAGERSKGGAPSGDRRAQFRQLIADAGVTITPDQPLSAADTEKLRKLAAERGIELPERFGGGRRPGDTSATRRTVYRLVSPLPNLKVEAVTARFGITDGSATEVIEGLNEGDVLVSSVYVAGEASPGAAPQQQTRNPFGGGSGRRP